MADFLSAYLLNNYYLTIATFIGINGLLGLSVYLALAAGQLTLGNAGFMSIGAYAAALLSTRAGWPFWLTIPIGALLAAAVAIPLGYASLRLRGVYLAIATLGFTETVRVLANAFEFTGGPLGVKNIPNVAKLLERALQQMISEPPLGLTFAKLANFLTLLAVLLVLAATVGFVARQGRSRVGRAFAAIKTDEIAAEAMGVNTTYFKVLAFTQGACLAGLAGGITAHITYAISPVDFGFARAVEMLTFVIVGGSSLPMGPVFGAAALMIMSEGLRDFRLFGAKMADYRFIIYGFLLMTTVIVLPQGLITPRLKQRVIGFFSRKGKGAAA